MVKVLMEGTIRGQNVGQMVRLLRQLRVLAMQQPGYISGETLHGVDDPILPGYQHLGIPERVEGLVRQPGTPGIERRNRQLPGICRPDPVMTN